MRKLTRIQLFSASWFFENFKHWLTNDPTDKFPRLAWGADKSPLGVKNTFARLLKRFSIESWRIWSVRSIDTSSFLDQNLTLASILFDPLLDALFMAGLSLGFRRLSAKYLVPTFEKLSCHSDTMKTLNFLGYLLISGPELEPRMAKRIFIMFKCTKIFRSFGAKFFHDTPAHINYLQRHIPKFSELLTFPGSKYCTKLFWHNFRQNSKNSDIFFSRKKRISPIVIPIKQRTAHGYFELSWRRQFGPFPSG